MRRLAAGIVALASFVCSAQGRSQEPRPPHITVRLSEIAWRPGAGGVSSAVLEGDPAVEGAPYTLALKLADGAWIRPHFHPLPKRVVVLAGTLLMGMGDSVVAGATMELPAGSFSVVPANAHHYEGGRGETVILLIGTGPLRTAFVDAQVMNGPLPSSVKGGRR
jgi:quercetin dioxygenase-like cupin family protein